MQEIINTELLNVSFDQLKNRLYCTILEFWKNDEQKTNRLKSVFQQFSQQQMLHKGTAILDTTGLRLMQPQAAEFVLLNFMKFLFDNHIKALAYVGNPDNVLLKMQFQRVLRSFERGIMRCSTRLFMNAGRRRIGLTRYRGSCNFVLAEFRCM